MAGVGSGESDPCGSTANGSGATGSGWGSMTGSGSGSDFLRVDDLWLGPGLPSCDLDLGRRQRRFRLGRRLAVALARSGS